MHKRGQVTVFVIVGIMVLLVFGVSFFVFQKITKEKLEEEKVIPQLAVPVKELVEQCLEKTAEEAFLTMGHRGGYYFMPFKSSILFLDDALVYFYLDNTYIAPTVQQSEKDAAETIKANLAQCINFTSLEKQGFIISPAAPDVLVFYTTDNIVVNLDYPITITKGNAITKISTFSHVTQLPMGKYFELAKTLTDDYVQRQALCLTCYDALAIQYDAIIDVYPIHDTSPYGNDIIWFYITDKKAQLSGQNFTFEFIVERQEKIKKKQGIALALIPEQTAQQGALFTYSVDAAGTDITFSDNTPLFDIHTTEGIISFMPKKEQVGAHLIKITAQDKLGNKAEKTFLLHVV